MDALNGGKKIHIREQSEVLQQDPVQCPVLQKYLGADLQQTLAYHVKSLFFIKTLQQDHYVHGVVHQQNLGRHSAFPQQENICDNDKDEDEDDQLQNEEVQPKIKYKPKNEIS